MYLSMAGFFNTANITSLDELKKEYYRLAKLHHPDAGGSNEEMKQVNKEYEDLFKRLLAGKNLTDQEQRIETEINDAYKQVIDQIIKIPGLVVEIIGLWIWVSGNTYPVREDLKKAGFLFASKKKMWFWRPPELKSSNFKEYSIEEIRSKYGSQVINPSYSSARSLNGLPTLAKKLRRLEKLLSAKSKISKYYLVKDIRKNPSGSLMDLKTLKRVGVKVVRPAKRGSIHGIYGFEQSNTNDLRVI